VPSLGVKKGERIAASISDDQGPIVGRRKQMVRLFSDIEASRLGKRSLIDQRQVGIG